MQDLTGGAAFDAAYSVLRGIITSEKNSLPLWENSAMPPYLAAVSRMDSRPMPSPYLLVERYFPLKRLTLPLKLLVATMQSCAPCCVRMSKRIFRSSSGISLQA